MGKLINGKWKIRAVNADGKGDGTFQRENSSFRDQILDTDCAKFTAQKDRYHLYVSLACPWAHRTLITRAMKKLEKIIDVSIVSPYMFEDGWSFDKDLPECTGDKLYSNEFLRDIYIKADSNVNSKVTVPVLWDKVNQTIVKSY